MAEIAARLGLSQTTVSFVLNGREKGISPETQERVLAAAQEMGYRKSSQSARADWTRVAYVSSNIEYFNFYTSFFAGVYNHLQRQSLEHKMEMFLLELDLSQGEPYVFQRLQEMRGLGIEVFLSNEQGAIKYLLEQDLKAILVQGGAMDGCVCVRCDDEEAGRVAARHALENGHRCAGMIFPSFESPRAIGFLDEFKAVGICPKEFRWTITMRHAEDAKILAELVREHKRKLPSIFYCFADNCMFPALRAFAANGLRVPDDVSLIGTDNLYWGSCSQPAFSTVDLREELFAEKVIEAIKHVKQNGAPYRLAVPVSILPRETVKNLSRDRHGK
ncbi:MAG: hypothetical protein A2X49_12045 [Lentisphaerae bacterium GWF2_52_8]|nr:MAG: hypothetical protein A2X49_12045 [Lentisphaerae bacterium GWF2_52_8]